MNKLKGSSVYLAGSIDMSPDGGVGWRDEITPWLNSLGIKVYNPCRKPINLGIEDETARAEIQKLKNEGRFDEIRPKYGIIRTVDLRMTDLSSFIIVYIDMEISVAGTAEEIAISNSCKKPIFIVCKQGRAALNNWYYFMLPHEFIFDSFEGLKEYLSKVDSGEDKRTFNRWYHFD